MSFYRTDYLSNVDPAYIELLYERYLEDPGSVDSTWRYFFDGLDLGESRAEELAQEIATEPPDSNGVSHGNEAAGASLTSRSTRTAGASLNLSNEAKVADLISAYRQNGVLLADINPLDPPLKIHPLLELGKFGLGEKNFNETYTAGKLVGLGEATLSQIIDHLQKTYCRSVGVEFTHINDPISRDWLQTRMETSQNEEKVEPEAQKRILGRLTESETFERFLHTRYVSQKRFSIEGGESMIPTLDRIIQVGADLGAEQFVLGMAHRGRLNVLRNIFQKKPEHIFTEFEDQYQRDDTMGEGDVKYHMGHSADIKTASGKEVHLSLASNPSHLEFVNPVVEGVTRGKQRYLKDKQRTRVIPILIHGDAAFAGQGVCYETLNLSQIPGYWTGGTIHIVANNQVGFTTDPHEGRSTSHPTDLAKMLEVPIFHVNGDAPEALWYVARLALEYRQEFKKDVFIDLVCYRKFGHNEGDEPSFTQPLMYKKIKSHASPRKIYQDQLVAAGVLSDDDASAMEKSVMGQLQIALDKTRVENPTPEISKYQSRWKGLKAATTDDDIFRKLDTAIKPAVLKKLGKMLTTVPTDFTVHKKLVRMLNGRKKMYSGEQSLDWGAGETLAYASLLADGNNVRLSGQDVERGTFSHRHAVLNDFETGKKFAPLNHLDQKDQGEFIIQNSTLSETAVLGFEFGWSLADPRALVIWEAQFGDFSNGAQVIIDQFITSSETKWQRASGLILFLPHGYEGQGPEHSSARLERFLQMCSKRNITVANFTTPAQLFHALRRHQLRDFRKPMIVMTPKSLLRHPKAVSPVEDFTQGSFEEVLDDTGIKDPTSVKRVIISCGKVFYDLHAKREELGLEQKVALLRLEQIYPWPKERLSELLNRFSKNVTFKWVQEEPKNMGAWTFVNNHWSGGYELFMELVNNRPIQYIGRGRQAASAVGSGKVHRAEQEQIIETALDLEFEDSVSVSSKKTRS